MRRGKGVRRGRGGMEGEGKGEGREREREGRTPWYLLTPPLI